MQDSEKILLIDIDGILRDFVASVLHVYKKYINTQSELLPEHINTWNMETLLGMSKEQFIDTFLNKYLLETMYEAKPFPGYENVNRLRKFMYVHIVTSQRPQSQTITLRWLQKYNIEYDAISFIDRKHHIKGDIIIEDRPKTLQLLRKLNEHKVITMHRPYNMQCEGLSVYNMHEFYVKCKELYMKDSSNQKPECHLVATDGNVFAIIGVVSKALQDAGLDDKAVEFTHLAMNSESYENVLQLCFEYVEVV